MEHFNMAELLAGMGTVAKAVVVVLGVMSAYSISITIERWLTYRQARKQSRVFTPAVAVCLREGRIDEAIALGEQNQKSHLAKVLVSGLHMLQPHVRSTEIPEKTLNAARRALERSTAMGIAELRRGLGSLATIGAVSPFVGLFGTTIIFDLSQEKRSRARRLFGILSQQIDQKRAVQVHQSRGTIALLAGRDRICSSMASNASSEKRKARTADSRFRPVFFPPKCSLMTWEKDCPGFLCLERVM